jgi:PAS domain S-box-containing protein
MKFGITYRLAASFMVVVLLLAVAVGVTIFQVDVIKNDTERIHKLRNPTARASSDMASHIYASLAALRGFMLTGDPSFRDERAVVWREIFELKATLDSLLKNWTNPVNNQVWMKFKADIIAFSAVQKQVEAIAHSIDERPATKILVTAAAPLAAKLAQRITAIIDLEISGNADRNGGNIHRLGVMTSTRGTLALSLASIRAYLLTGEKKFVDEFGKLWARNGRYFAELRILAPLLSPPQLTLFNEFKDLRAEFTPLPPRMFEIRASEKWNMANYLFATEAVPRAEKILVELLGAVQKDGSRAGGMAGNQQILLAFDVEHSAAAADRLLLLQWLLLLAGASLGTLVAFLTARSITAPLKNITAAMLCLADGQNEIEIPSLNRKDEIGTMAGAVQIFKKNAVERDRLESEQKKLFEELDFQKSALDEHAILSLTDIQGNIIYANNKFIDISGYSRAELIGQNHRILKSDEHTAALYADLWDTISCGDIWHGEIKNLKKNGKPYWVMSTIVPALDQAGKPFQFISIRTDISGRKDAKFAALAAGRAKSNLLANMSHELRTPLNAIIGFSGLMIEESLGPIGNEKYRNYSEDIFNSGQHLLELIADILDVSAIEAGSLSLHRNNLNLPEFLEAAIRIIRLRADESQLTITSILAPEITEIYADERRLKQIVINLLSNAVKFTPEGGSVAVTSSLNVNGDLTLSVSDTGIGMDDDEIGTSMSVFGQVESGLGRTQEGTGLGLPLTMGLVELHDGSMVVKSAKGHGTTVTVTLPGALTSEGTS